jgi:hypothetical protein
MGGIAWNLPDWRDDDAGLYPLRSCPVPFGVIHAYFWDGPYALGREICVGKIAFSFVHRQKGLHFARLPLPGGKRKFAVEINGNKILNEFDPYQEAGTKNKVVVKDFNGIEPDSDGNIIIKFEKGSVDEAEVDGIEIMDAGS